jgi:hypothetical protein
MAVARANNTATLLPSGNVLVAGGQDDDPLASAELYAPGAGTFSVTGCLATKRSFHTATLLQSGKVLMVGGNGQNFEALASAELYDPE